MAAGARYACKALCMHAYNALEKPACVYTPGQLCNTAGNAVIHCTRGLRACMCLQTCLVYMRTHCTVVDACCCKCQNRATEGKWRWACQHETTQAKPSNKYELKIRMHACHHIHSACSTAANWCMRSTACRHHTLTRAAQMITRLPRTCTDAAMCGPAGFGPCLNGLQACCWL
jgi:hypothetical protein